MHGYSAVNPFPFRTQLSSFVRFVDHHWIFQVLWVRRPDSLLSRVPSCSLYFLCEIWEHQSHQTSLLGFWGASLLLFVLLHQLASDCAGIAWREHLLRRNDAQSLAGFSRILLLPLHDRLHDAVRLLRP